MSYHALHNLGIPQLTRQQMGPEINERIRCARLWCQRYWKLLCHPDLTSRAKFEIYKVFVKPILTYGCELWQLNKTDCKKLLRFEASILLEIYKSKYPPRHPKRLRQNLRAVYRRYRGTNVVHHVNCERLNWRNLLTHEETALRKPQKRSRPTVHWWDKSHSISSKRPPDYSTLSSNNNHAKGMSMDDAPG